MVALTEDILIQGYTSIIDRLRQVDVSSNKLETLKEKYREEIASERAYSQVYDLGDLIDILEKRDFLNEYAVDVIIEIMNVIGCDDHFKDEVIQHHARTCGLTRNYLSRPEWNEYCEMTFNVTPEFVIPEEVIQIVSEGMHESWESLAERLEIAEGDVIRINSYDWSDVNKCREILKLFAETPPLYSKRGELKTALSRERRNDLLRKVDRVFVTQSHR